MDEQLLARLDRLEGLLEQVLTAQTKTENRLQNVETKLESVETRLESVETRLEGVETKLEGMETRLQRLEEGQAALSARTDIIKEAVDGIDEKLKLAIERLDYFGDKFLQHDHEIWRIKRRVGC